MARTGILKDIGKGIGKGVDAIGDVVAGIFGKGKTAKKVRVAKKTVKANKAGVVLAKETGKGLKEAEEALKVSKEALKGLRKTGKVRAIKTGRALLLGSTLLVGGDALTPDDEQGKTERVEITSNPHGMEANPPTKVENADEATKKRLIEAFSKLANLDDLSTAAQNAGAAAVKAATEELQSLGTILLSFEKTGALKDGASSYEVVYDDILKAKAKDRREAFKNSLYDQLTNDKLKKTFYPEGKDMSPDEFFKNYNNLIEKAREQKAANQDQARKAPAVNKTVADATVTEEHQLPNGQTIAIYKAKAGRGGMGA